MRWVTKEDNISTLIEYGKENLSSDKYLFVTTIDMIEHLEINLETFCKKIDQKTIISGYTENDLAKANNRALGFIMAQHLKQSGIDYIPADIPRFELAILGVKKELIEKEELENFVNVDEELLPIIQIINSLEGFAFNESVGNKEELDWFVDKIHGKKIEYTDHHAVSYTEATEANREAGGSLEAFSWGEIKWEPKIELHRPSAMMFTYYGWQILQRSQNPFDMGKEFYE